MADGDRPELVDFKIMDKEELMDNLDELEKTVEEADKIKRLVLTLLHWQGAIAFDASQSVLDPEIEAAIKGEG